MKPDLYNIMDRIPLCFIVVSFAFSFTVFTKIDTPQSSNKDLLT